MRAIHSPEGTGEKFTYNGLGRRTHSVAGDAASSPVFSDGSAAYTRLPERRGDGTKS